MDETKVTPETEVKEGTVEAEIQKEEVAPTPKNKAPETVPLPVYLELKEDLKALKQEIKESKSKSTQDNVRIEGISDLAEKYPDVDKDFIKDLLSSATVEATKKIEEKYNPILARQEEEKKQQAFDRAFDNLFDKALQDNPDLPKNIDKDAIKELAVTPKYRNIPVADILVKMYGSSATGKDSSETEVRTAADKVDDIVTFEGITKEQRAAVMADPKARAKYFSWLDTQPGR